MKDGKGLYMLTCENDSEENPFTTLVVVAPDWVGLEGGRVYEVRDLHEIVRELISGLEYPVKFVLVECIDDILIPLRTPILSDDGITTPSHWDCECEEDYIHPKYEPVCVTCGTMHWDQPDSHYSEVLEKLRKL